ncbi:Swt1 family HEPN domain-containing protein [Curtobacterium sp. MCJR17_043]|uniref:Swt1 family HEPN domain-containing protein n=1 Tax=Curtobacterium sp. MCJR17_043 TaxID=2175660 RepID=UPI0024DFD9DF|nr:Swt1 family HEPN domain-containing protein [Curtobacterium sp. MCJR17_043]WIB36942.1 Swt1 family HEPN domain-containing protein [Curtobacterium sp. MCJR17_043]
MNNADHVAAGLRTLAAGLRPVVASTLEPRLRPGVSWTEILAVKDREKGGGERRYDEADLQVLLRIVTETLPRLGRPFDALLDRNGSRLAGELREVRNRWAHNVEFDDADTYRALDSVYRLLDLLSAVEEADQAASLRRDFQVTMVGSAAGRPQVVDSARSVTPTDERTDSPRSLAEFDGDHARRGQHRQLRDGPQPCPCAARSHDPAPGPGGQERPTHGEHRVGGV